MHLLPISQHLRIIYPATDEAPMHPQPPGLIATRLHYFQQVVELKSIRQASEALGVAPSALSRSIQQLELDLGTPLFERVRQRLKLTSAGEMLAFHARASQKELARAVAFIKDLQGLRQGHVSIRAIESVTRGMLPAVLCDFWDKHPNVSVDIRTTGSEEAVEALMKGDCDLAVAFDVRVPRKLRRLASANLHVGALVRPDHKTAALPKGKGARLRDYVGDPILTAGSTLTLGRLLEDAAVDAGVELRIRAISTSISNLVDLACAGRGVSFQTRVGVERELASGALVYVPLRDRELKGRRLSLMASAQGPLSDAPAALANILSKAIAAIDEGGAA